MPKSTKDPSKPKKASQEDRRAYPQSDLKVLYGRSAGLCAYPACRKPCIKTGVSVIDKVMVGQIAHIESFGPGGPRHNPNLSKKQRDSYDNWVLLCNIHHPIIDEQDDAGAVKYDVSTIKRWKQDLESFITKRLEKTMPDVTSVELQLVTKYVLKVNAVDGVDFTLIDPQSKLDKNGLTGHVKNLLHIGLGKAAEVARFVDHSSLIQPEFALELKAGFVQQYKKLWDEDLRGDALFESLRLFACQFSDDPKMEAAGLAVLSFLFERCEVFEK